MMLEPSIDALQDKIKSKYSLVTLSAKRARQIRELNNLMIETPKSHKFVGMALEEILAGKLVIEENK
ncbi:MULTISPECIES: DNA-directed RNA polymerase subunit omega [unclassified Virgibacillus]|uniref:DNA-directed RNA polymerase subunit omega n=1 Tax=unclassified Virgibacillus TaxID=2620237 RepID=UPI0024DEFD6E|nr:DNA-directed RNA polymerase subunit omega [Virgibacillus sp. LDC-1]